ncbi:glutamyl aminopeptidase-like [Coccinella septempunctata]|uniref:glutamyl aminopeptidase-like n=1 Tax=Coccinella septempunctata TaxID=41139 RepID=UPI001D09323D|nr:glutamyl aminopeptidase-like [Coccinella septempunctata]
MLEEPTGIFRGNFSSSSEKSYYAVSFFEPMGARKAFPCFDEPGMIATFELTIGRKKNYNTTSNMQLVKSEPMEGEDGWFLDHFVNSFPMSTYMLCFMIYDAEFVLTGKQEDQIKILVRKEMRSSMSMIPNSQQQILSPQSLTNEITQETWCRDRDYVQEALCVPIEQSKVTDAKAETRTKLTLSVELK